MIDVRNHPETLEAINAIINNGGAAEVKVERRKESLSLVVVELSRKVKHKAPAEESAGKS